MAEKIYRIEEFREWMPENGVTGSSPSSYLSNLRKLGDGIKMRADGTDVFEHVGQLIQNNNTALAFDTLLEVEEKLSSLLSSHAISEQTKHWLRDSRSALRKYINFLQDDIEDIPDEEEFIELNEDASTFETCYPELNDTKEGDLVEYKLEDLKKNFAFRLFTQNRMSNNKDIFYPISIIKKLFCYSQREGKKTGVPNNDHDWIKDWTESYAGDIKVLLNDTSYRLSDVKALLLSPATEDVYIQTSDVNKNLRVFTETSDGKKEPMKAKALKGIHIDHSPLMAEVLTDNISSIPAIDALSKEIKSAAKSKRIDIRPANFGKISKVLFAKEEYVSTKLLPLIPALKEELNILKQKCTLTLMQASHNLKKK